MKTKEEKFEEIRTLLKQKNSEKKAGLIGDECTIIQKQLEELLDIKIKLIVRGMCCVRPGRAGLSENIEVISIVGEYLEHSRVYYFHNADNPKVYIGSADAMVRSFDRRIESLFLLEAEMLKKQAMNILRYNLRDNVNAYSMKEDGTYVIKELNGEPPFNIQKEFYAITPEKVVDVRLF